MKLTYDLFPIQILKLIISFNKTSWVTNNTHTQTYIFKVYIA